MKTRMTLLYCCWLGIHCRCLRTRNWTCTGGLYTCIFLPKAKIHFKIVKNGHFVLKLYFLFRKVSKQKWQKTAGYSAAKIKSRKNQSFYPFDEKMAYQWSILQEISWIQACKFSWSISFIMIRVIHAYKYLLVSIILKTFLSYNSFNVVKGIGFNTKDRGNKTGYICSVITWNCRSGFAGCLDLFFRYFNLKLDTYYRGRISTRDALQKSKNQKNYDKRIKIKVSNFKGTGSN